MKVKMFVTQPIEASALKKLTALMEVEVHPDSTKTIAKEDLIRGIQGKDVLFCRLGDQIDADVISANKNVKLIATMATGSGGIDVGTATKFKIPVIGRDVSNQKEGYSGIVEETADLTWALLMAVARRILEGDRLVRSGLFPGPHSMYLLGSGVYGKSIGIVGMGKIGRAMARRARAFGMGIFYYSRRRHPDVEEEFDAAYLPFEELLQRVDFVCMLPQYSAETHHMIGEKAVEPYETDGIFDQYVTGSGGRSGGACQCAPHEKDCRGGPRRLRGRAHSRPSERTDRHAELRFDASHGECGSGKTGNHGQ